MSGQILAVDFGTSNSAAGIMADGVVHRIPIEEGADTLPTAVFFPADRGPMLIGQAAAQALIAGDEGRYMRALKSVLGTSLLHETRLIGGARRSVSDIIAAFLTRLRERSQAATGLHLTRVLSGRPVHFHSNDPVRDAQAARDLRDCYHAAGFTDVSFLPEPEAAARASHADLTPGGIGLVVDIGGGTSDFTLFRQDGGADGAGIGVLASHGIRLGGTDFDHALSMTHVMPLLGHGTSLRREMGPGLLPVPNGIYADLATWAKIPFVYTPETRRMVASMMRLSQAPSTLARLQDVITDELGHELAFAVEAGKIAANDTDNPTPAQISMGFIARGLDAPIDATSMARALDSHRADLIAAIARTLDLADLSADRITDVVLVGGSSLMGLVADAARTACPAARMRGSQAFTAVIDGLILTTTDL